MNKVSIIALLTCVSFSPVAMADYEAEKNCRSAPFKFK